MPHPVIVALLVAAASAATPAKGDLLPLFGTDDYPPEALVRREQGTVAMRLSIDAAGRVSGCAVEHSSGSAALDAKSCAVILERARYEPARDSNGNAVPGTDTARIRWVLPRPQPSPAEERTLEVTVLIKNHSVASCSARTSPPSSPTEASAMCIALQRAAEALAATHPPSLAEPFRARFRTELLVGAEPPPPPNERVILRNAILLGIDAAGRLASCEPIPEVEVAKKPVPRACDPVTKGTFEALPAGEANRSLRHMMLLRTVTVEPGEGPPAD